MEVGGRDPVDGGVKGVGESVNGETRSAGEGAQRPHNDAMTCNSLRWCCVKRPAGAALTAKAFGTQLKETDALS